MFVSLKWLLLLILTGVHAQEPRKRNSNDRFSYEEPPVLLERNNDDVSCAVGTCVKRSPGQDEFGPFWANRGKKDPTYARSKLFADEPHWILVQRDDINENEPFYITRGKKNFNGDAPQFWRYFIGAHLVKKINNFRNIGDLPYFLEPRKGHGTRRSTDFQ